MADAITRQKYLADFSLGLINRTGAFVVCRDLLLALPQYFDQTRYWRFFFSTPPEGLPRKLLARLMLKEISARQLGLVSYWPTGRQKGRLPTLFLDPLYTIWSDLKADDIVLCHDVGPITHREFFGDQTHQDYKAAYERMAKIGPGVVFVSEASRRAFQMLYGTAFRFMHVIPLYVRKAMQGGAVEPVKGVKPPFLLTVGAFEKRKNHSRILDAYVKANLAERGIQYVFCGPRANETEAVLAKAAGIPGVVALSYLSESQLRWLYQEARGFVLPSLLEGFGVPVLEAAGAGLVSLASQDSALEEALGGNGVFVDPLSVDSIAQGMERLIGLSPEERSQIVAKGREHARLFSLERYVESWRGVLEHNK